MTLLVNHPDLVSIRERLHQNIVLRRLELGPLRLAHALQQLVLAELQADAVTLRMGGEGGHLALAGF